MIILGFSDIQNFKYNSCRAECCLSTLSLSVFLREVSRLLQRPARRLLYSHLNIAAPNTMSFERRFAYLLLTPQYKDKILVLFSCAAILYPTPLVFFCFVFCPSIVCGMQDCGSCRGQWGTKGSREGRGAPKPIQNLKSRPIQTKPFSTQSKEVYQSKLNQTISNQNQQNQTGFNQVS